MSAENSGTSADGTAVSPKYYEGPVFSKDDASMHQRYFTYRTDEGLVTGKNSTVVFSIARPRKEVWSYLKDFNLWQNSYGYYYSGVVGDLDGQTFFLEVRKAEKSPIYPTKMRYQVVRVIPEQAIVLFQPIPEDGSAGRVSPGFHMFTLSENEGKTVVTILMNHATLTKDKTVEEALTPWRKQAPESQRFWHEIFIPNLRKLASDGAK